MTPTLENIYHALPLFSVTAVLYTVSAALLFTRTPLRLALGIFGGAVILHAITLLSRSLILARPPVATLYESILYVSLVCALAGFALWHLGKRPALLQCGAFAAAALLVLAAFFEPASIKILLAAVLNSNFWLATHVVIITSGYGVCIVTALLAHFALIAASRGRLPPTPPHILHIAGLAALFFMAFGTVLGGIWADQSWGRFWGWDPKENGALLIVLWLIWLQHARVTSQLSPTLYTAGLAFLNVIVALSWFGVNMLGAGLHSYGFTAGTFQALSTFCTGEIILIAALLWRARTRKAIHAS